MSKKDERRLRNLQSANASRQRRKEQISALTEEKARLTEANALMRARLNIAPDAVLPAISSLEGQASRSDMAELGPAMQQLLRRNNIKPEAAVDLLERLVVGDKGKGSSLDADALKRLKEAARKAPKDVQRPLKYYVPGEPAPRRGGGAGSSSSGSGSSRARGSSGKKKK